MSFTLFWLPEAQEQYQGIRAQALAADAGGNERKSSRAQGLFKQIHQAISLLQDNPRHPGLQTQEYNALVHPYDPRQKVFEAYAQNRTPGAYRIFWCYGPRKNQITVIAITPHP